MTRYSSIFTSKQLSVNISRSDQSDTLINNRNVLNHRLMSHCHCTMVLTPKANTLPAVLFNTVYTKQINPTFEP